MLCVCLCHNSHTVPLSCACSAVCRRDLHVLLQTQSCRYVVVSVDNQNKPVMNQRSFSKRTCLSIVHEQPASHILTDVFNIENLSLFEALKGNFDHMENTRIISCQELGGRIDKNDV